MTTATPLRFLPPRVQSKGEARDRTAALYYRAKPKHGRRTPARIGRADSRPGALLPSRETDPPKLLRCSSVDPAWLRAMVGLARRSAPPLFPSAAGPLRPPPRNNEHTATQSGRRAGRGCFLRESRPHLPLRAARDRVLHQEANF